MAVKSAKAVKRGPGRPRTSDNGSEATTNPNIKPVVIHLHKKLHARVRTVAMLLGMNVSELGRELFTDWVNTNAKKAAQLMNEKISATDDEDEEEEEVADTSDDDTDSDDDEDDDE